MNQQQYSAKMVALFIGALCLFTTTITRAQAPGYMGKRWGVGVSLPIGAPILTGHLFDGGVNESTYLHTDGSEVNKIIFKPTVSVSYSLSRKVAIHGFYRFFSSQVATSGYFNPYRYQDPTKPATMSCNAFGITAKWFKQSNLAPLGAYRAFTVEKINSSLNAREIFYGHYPSISTQSDWAISFTFGKQVPLSNFLILDVSGSVGLPVTLGNRKTIYPTDDEWAAHVVENALFNYYLVSLDIGIFILP